VSRRKTYKYDRAEWLDNVIQSTKENFGAYQGRWRSDYFKNSNPIVLELGCGKGEYSNGLARLFPDKNFIGIDIKGDRLASGGLVAKEEGLQHVAFLRIMMQFIDEHFEENEVDEIWITFPDPRPKDRDEKKRLTNPFYLAKYRKILKPGGILHLKTDAEAFFDFSKESLESQHWPILISTHDLYQSEWNKDHFGIKTRFETIFYNKGFSIHYLRAENKKEA
jgi:tRNA (guanine-N7-)-methyltransferase